MSASDSTRVPGRLLPWITALWCVPIIAVAFATAAAAQGDDELRFSAQFTVASGLRAADSDTSTPGRPAVAFGGSSYLVVSCRDAAPPTGIVGVLLSADGVIQREEVVGDINPIFGCLNQRPAAAFDGTNFLVVFPRVASDGSTGIVATRVSSTGAVVGGTGGTTILRNVAEGAALAFDGTNFLVVSSRFTSSALHDIVAARVTPTISVLGEMTVFSAPGGQVQPSVAFDGTNYLVIWSDTRSGSPVGPDADIIGTRVSPGGTVLDPGGVPISTAPGAQAAPHLTFASGQYFAVWEDTRNGSSTFPPQLDIFATRIAPSGAVLDGPPGTGGIAVTSAAVPEQHPSAAFDGSNYLVVWDVAFFFNPPVGIYAARVSASGVLVDGPAEDGGVLVSAPACVGCRLVHANIGAAGSGALIVWVKNTEAFAQTKDVEGVLVEPPSEPEPTPLAALHTRAVRVRTSPEAGTFLVHAQAKLGAASDGILPQSEPVVVVLADPSGRTFEATLPPGSLRPKGRRTFIFTGGVSGIRWMIVTLGVHEGEFSAQFLATRVRVAARNGSLLTVSLAVGNDAGSDASACRAVAGVAHCR